MKLFIDMDGVLADFFNAAIRVNINAIINRNVGSMASDERQQQINHAIQSYPKGEYQIEKHLGISSAEFWSAIDEHGGAFWSCLDLCEGAIELWDIAQNHNPIVLTSPSLQPHCVSGKLQWLQRMYGSNFRDYIFCPAQHKHLLAGPESILIDDRESNCDDWMESGGSAILWPHLGNRSDLSIDIALNLLKEQIEEFGK